MMTIIGVLFSIIYKRTYGFKVRLTQADQKRPPLDQSIRCDARRNDYDVDSAAP